MNDQRRRAYIASKPNILELIYREFKLKHNEIVANPNLSEAMIKEIFASRWCGKGEFAYLSSNPAATLEFARANQHLPWDWRSMQGNPNVTMDDLDQVPLSDVLDFNEISYNPNLTPKFYSRYEDSPDWNYFGIALSKRFAPEFFMDKNVDCISNSLNITLDFIEKNPLLDYYWSNIIRTLEPDQDFLRYAEANNAYYAAGYVPLNYFAIYEAAQLTPAFIDEIFERWPRLAEHIDYQSMSSNKYLSLADMEEIEKKHPAPNNHRTALTLPTKLVSQKRTTRWDLRFIAPRGDIMPEDILKSPLFIAQYSRTDIIKQLFRNPNITVDFVRKNKEHIDYYALSHNTFLWNDDAYRIHMQRDIAARQSVVFAAAREIFGEFARLIKKFIDHQ